MEGGRCQQHGAEKVVYCAECRTLSCGQCPRETKCKAEHKRVEARVAARQLQEGREKEVEEMVRLLTEAIQMEGKLEKHTKRLEELKKQHYVDVFEALLTIRERIESLQAQKEKLPAILDNFHKYIGTLKTTLIEQLTLAKAHVQETRRQLNSHNFPAVLIAPTLAIFNVAEMYNGYSRLEYEFKEFFQSLDTFENAFTRDLATQHDRQETHEMATQTEALGEPLPALQSPNDDLKQGLKEALERLAETPKQTAEELQRTLQEVLAKMAETPKRSSEELKQSLKEVLAQLTRSNQEFYEQARKSLQEVAAAVKPVVRESSSNPGPARDETQLRVEERLKEFQAQVQRDVNEMLAEKQQLQKSPDTAKAGPLVQEQVTQLVERKHTELHERLTVLENQLRSVLNPLSAESASPPEDPTKLRVPRDWGSKTEPRNRDARDSFPDGRSTHEGLVEERRGQRPATRPGYRAGTGGSQGFVGLNLKFASYLSVGNVNEILRQAPSGSIIYLVSVKNGLGPADLASLFNEIDVAQSIESVSLEHLYFKEQTPFTVLIKNARNLRSLELLSCPFVSSQILQIVEQIAQSGPTVEELTIDNSLISDRVEELIRTINQTHIKRLKITNPKMRISKFIELFRQHLADTVEIVDFGLLPPDPRAHELLNDWKAQKTVLYSSDSDQAMRKTYKY